MRLLDRAKVETSIKPHIHKVACFTGHRPHKLSGFGETDLTKKVRNRLSDIISALLAAGVTHFISGGALGVDQWAAEEVLRQGGRLLIARPFPSQDRKWPDEARRYYADLLNRAHAVVDVSPDPYSAEKMQIRNQWMVDHSSTVVAVWDGSPSGTGNCVQYAKQTGKRIIVINPKKL